MLENGLDWAISREVSNRETFIDYPAREYTLTGGNGLHLNR
jgi:hypothetical protein